VKKAKAITKNKSSGRGFGALAKKTGGAGYGFKHSCVLRDMVE
jgi:hypothetical protein